MKCSCVLNYRFYLFALFNTVETVFAVERNINSKSSQVLSDPIGVSHYFQMFLGLFLIVLLIFGLAWLIKRINNFQGNMCNTLRVLSMISVGQKEKVALIQVGEKQLLIGVAQGNINTLLVLDEVITDNVSKNVPFTFSDKLSAVLKGKAVQS